MRFRLSLFALIILFQSLTGSTQNTPFVVSGTAHDATGSVLPGATVTFSQGGIEQPLTTSTDSNGEFRLSLPKSGSYRIEVQDDGFTPFSGSVTLDDSSPT